MFMVSVLLYLLAAPAGKRLSLFLLMAQDAVVSLVMMFVAFQGLGKKQERWACFRSLLPWWRADCSMGCSAWWGPADYGPRLPRKGRRNHGGGAGSPGGLPMWCWGISSPAGSP